MAAKQRHIDDEFGRTHFICFVDYKQLLPATAQPPFIAADSDVWRCFRFHVLRQNRRLAKSDNPQHQARLDSFHEVLENVAMGHNTPLVRRFVIDAYVRGAMRTQENVGYDEGTACFTLRRYRNGWNRTVLQRLADRTHRSLRVKAAFCAKGARDRFLREHAAAAIRRQVKSQSLVNLRLAGQFFNDTPMVDRNSETPCCAKPHLMRAMLAPTSTYHTALRTAPRAGLRIGHQKLSVTEENQYQQRILNYLYGFSKRRVYRKTNNITFHSKISLISVLVQKLFCALEDNRRCFNCKSNQYMH